MKSIFDMGKKELYRDFYESVKNGQSCQAIITIGNRKFCCQDELGVWGVHVWNGEIDGKEVSIRWK